MVDSKENYKFDLGVKGLKSLLLRECNAEIQYYTLKPLYALSIDWSRAIRKMLANNKMFHLRDHVNKFFPIYFHDTKDHCY